MAENKNKNSRKPVNRKKEKNGAGNAVIFLVVLLTLIFVIILLVPTLRNKKEKAELLKLQEAYMESVAEAESWSAELQELRKQELTEQQIVEIAREKFGLVFPDEIQFVPEK